MADGWNDIGYVALGWVRCSGSYTRVRSSSSNAKSGIVVTNASTIHTCSGATDSDADAGSTNSHFAAAYRYAASNQHTLATDRYTGANEYPLAPN